MMIGPLLHPFARAGAFKLFRLNTDCGECPLLAFKNDDGEISRPAPTKTDIYSGPTFAH